MKKVMMVILMLQLLTINVFADEVLKVGIYEEKPIMFMQESGAPSGFAIDILKNIQEEEGYTYEYVYGTFSECLEMLKKGEIDVLPNLAYTDERSKYINYSKEHFVENWGTVVLNENIDVRDLSELDSLKIGLVKDGMSSNQFQEAVNEKNINISFVFVDTFSQLFKMVDIGTLDGAVVNRFVVNEQKDYFNFKETSMNFSPMKIKIGFKKDVDKKIIKQFDEHIKNMKNDPNSVFYTSIDKWFNFAGVSNREIFIKTVMVLAFVYILGMLMHYNFGKMRRELESSKKELCSEQSKLVQRKREIHKIEVSDQLTDLPNKNALKEEMRIACKNNAPFLVGYIDIDNLNKVNNSLGDEYGDQLILEIVKRLKENAGDDTVLYRYEGDEFVIMCFNDELIDNIDLNVRQMLKILEEPIELAGINFVTTISLGISQFPQDSKQPEQLIKNAKIAADYVKRHGKNNYKVHTEDIAKQIMEKTILESELRKAIENDEFEVYYQPKVDVITEKIIGMEALVRWVNSNGEIIHPIRFIPLAEELSLINLIDERIMLKACRQTNKWNNKGYNISVSVNLSAQQFENKNLIDMIKHSLKESRINTKYLNIEITESAVMKDVQTSIDLIKKIRELDIKVSLDDFGTGYSSLNYLRKLPIDVLKIDKSSLDLVLEDKKERIITEAIISLAHNMNLEIVAEGVETKEQLDFLKETKCHQFQGYYFSKPVTSQEFEELLKKKC